MNQKRKLLKVSLLLIAFAISLAILSACNGQSSLPSEHFEGNCITKGFTRYYMANGTYVDREDAEFGAHSYGEGKVESELSCTTPAVTRYVCAICNDERVDFTEKLGHDYDEKVTKESTCTETGNMRAECKRCHDIVETVIAKLPHDYDEEILKPATCTEKGRKTMTCRTCLYTEDADIATLPHTTDGEVYYNSEAHWSICTVCNNECYYSAHINETAQVAATCVDHAYTHISCRDCDYSRDVVDENSQLSHRYEAYTCLGCQRDKLLDYKAEFDSKGSGASNLIEIKSEEMFVCFYDFLIAYQITTPKYVEISYTTVKEDNINSFLANAKRKITATNWSISTNYTYKYNPITKANEVTYLNMSATNSGNFVFADVASITPNDYNADVCEQYNSYQFDTDTARPSTFDDFAYKSRKNKMNVSSSDQLFFAFEHGYSPVVKSGSSAQSMLDKAKIVARRIMNDGMSDLQKVRAIYNYLVSDVAYDYGIVKRENTAFAKCASYYLEGVFNYGIAVCDGISKAFCVLAGLENIKCVRVTSSNHAWNKVYIDVNGDGEKAWFSTDATWGNQSILNTDGKNGEYLSVENFLFTDAYKISKGQRGLNYVDTDSDAVTEENPFEYYYYGEDENDSCDFVITSDKELLDMVEYMKDKYDGFARNQTITLNFFFTSDYCTKGNISNKLSNILRRQWVFIYNSVYFTDLKDTASLSYDGVEGYSMAIFIKK